MDIKAFVTALSQIAEEKNLPQDIVMGAVEAAIAAAYRKDYGTRDQVVRAKVDPVTGGVTVWVVYTVVAEDAEIENPEHEKTVSEAQELKKGAKIGEEILIEDHPKDFGRIAAQTAKQVILQRIREAEREVIFNEYKDKENTLVTGVIQRIEDGNIFIDLGRATGVMFPPEQIPMERYYINQRLKVYLVKVDQATRGPQILLSRSHPGMIKLLFEMEVPEIPQGTVELKGIAREAGGRTKVAVSSNQEGVDPVGSCVGQRGTRIQAITAELGEEKVDVIPYEEDPKIFITNSLSPAKVTSIDLNDKEKKAIVKVPEDQLSLAIGKQGQNVRLAAKLTGWNIDIVGADESKIEAISEAAAKPASPKKKKKDLEDEIIKAIEAQSGEEVHEAGEHKVDVETKIEGSEEGAEDRDLADAAEDVKEMEADIEKAEELVEDKIESTEQVAEVPETEKKEDKSE